MEENKKVLIAGLGFAVLVILVLAIYYFFIREKPPEMPEQPEIVEEAVVPGETEEIVEEPQEVTEQIQVNLDESDEPMRDLAANLSSRPELAQWLLTEDLVRKFAAAVDNIANGQSPRNQIGFFKPDNGISREEFLKVLVEIKYDPEKAQYSTWLFTIAKRLMLHRIKLNKKFESIDQDHEGATIADFLVANPYEDTTRKEEVLRKKVDIIKQKIPELPIKYARVLTMREIDGLSYQEISDYLNLNLSTVKSQIRQGRRLLRSKIEREFEILDEIL